MRVETALKLLDDPDDLTRAEAAASLGRTRDPRAIRGLIRLLDDKEMVRRAASDPWSTTEKHCFLFWKRFWPTVR